ncbi:Type IV secretory protein VirD4 (plasmid) [Paraburkholderia kururiensis]|uniref:type IV secretion system DNA-binding domain-containing protein n=1 Tax=Paraburkholderia kururiensis TaxID=984307 RepID=UPI0039A61218
MSDKVISDAGAGRALFLTRMKLTIHAVSMSLWVGALPGLIVPIALWLSCLSPRDLDIVKLNMVSHLVKQDASRKWRIRDEAGEDKLLTVVKANGDEVQLLTPPQYRTVTASLSRPVTVFGYVVLASLLCGVLGYLSVWWSLSRLGRRARENKRVDGVEELVAPKELSRLVRKEEPGPYTILDVALPKSAPMQGIQFMGAQGTGKSLAIHDLMQQVFQRKRKCIIYDQSGEYFRAYFRPGKDYFFNPSMLGSVPWSIFRELQNTYDSNTLAHSFLPPKAGVVHGANAFFEDAARALFSVITLRLRQRGAVYTRTISEAILSMPEDELELLIRESVASSAVGGDSKGQRQGVISSIAIYLDGIAAVQDGEWTLRQFFERDDDARFFIVSTDDTKAMFAPLYRLLLAISFGIIAAKREICHYDRYWYFLDEVHVLGDIKLDETQATHRKYGVCVATGIQADTQYITSIGHERAKTLMNCFNTSVMLRANEPEMRDRMARRLGRMDMEVVSNGQALAVSDWRDGGSLNQGQQEKWLVMPDKLGKLKNCMAYVQVPGDYPATLVNYRHWLPAWYRPWARVNRFAARQEDPPRDPRFRIVVAEGQDALASVRAEAEARRVEAERAAAAKDTIERTGKWVVRDLETGEIVPAGHRSEEALTGEADGELNGKSDDQGGLF